MKLLYYCKHSDTLFQDTQTNFMFNKYFVSLILASNSLTLLNFLLFDGQNQHESQHKVF